MPHLFPKSVQSGADLSAKDALCLLKLWGQSVVELALPDDVLGPVPKPCPVQLCRESGEHWPQVLQVIHHHAQLQAEENVSRCVSTRPLKYFCERLFLLACSHHVDGAAMVGVLGQQPDPLLQDVTVVHHNLAHILQKHGKHGWLLR